MVPDREEESPPVCGPPRPPSSLMSGGNSFRLLDDLLFVFQGQRFGAAVGEINDQIVVPSHNTRKAKPLDSLPLDFAG